MAAGLHQPRIKDQALYFELLDEVRANLRRYFPSCSRSVVPPCHPAANPLSTGNMCIRHGQDEHKLLHCALQFVRAVMGRWPKAVLQFEVRRFSRCAPPALHPPQGLGNAFFLA